MWNYELGVVHTFDERFSAELTTYIADGSNRIETGGVYPNLTLSNLEDSFIAELNAHSITGLCAYARFVPDRLPLHRHRHKRKSET